MQYIKPSILAVLLACSIALSPPTAKSQGLERPIPINTTIPPYPALARAKKISGTVLVDVQVNAQGIVVEAKPTMGAEILQDIARKASFRWRFKPLNAGAKVVSIRLTYIFHDASYIAPVKEPDFTSLYQVEIMYPEGHF